MKGFFSGAAGMLALMAATGLTAAGAAAAANQASPTYAGAMKQTAAPFRFTIGDAQVMAASDCTILIDLHNALQGIPPAEMDALLAANYLANPVETSINVFVIQQAGRTVMVDAGLGDPTRPGGCGRTFDALATAGIAPDQVNDIVITHLHLDHVGGLAWGGKTMFPNATIHVSKAELDSYLNPPATLAGRARQINDLVVSILKPYLDAGKVKTFTQSGEVLPGLTAKLLPGHTPGSATYTLASGGQELVFIGDYNPVPVVGFRHPEAPFVTDQDKAQAPAVRKEMLAEFSKSHALVAAPHISFPGIGHIGVDAGGYRWFPIEYSNRDANQPAAKF